MRSRGPVCGGIANKRTCGGAVCTFLSHPPLQFSGTEVFLGEKRNVKMYALYILVWKEIRRNCWVSQELTDKYAVLQHALDLLGFWLRVAWIFQTSPPLNVYTAEAEAFNHTGVRLCTEKIWTRVHVRETQQQEFWVVLSCTRFNTSGGRVIERWSVCVCVAVYIRRWIMFMEGVSRFSTLSYFWSVQAGGYFALYFTTQWFSLKFHISFHNIWCCPQSKRKKMLEDVLFVENPHFPGIYSL